VSPVNSLGLVVILLKLEEIVVEKLVKALVGIVDAKLLEAVVLF